MNILHISANTAYKQAVFALYRHVAAGNEGGYLDRKSIWNAKRGNFCSSAAILKGEKKPLLARTLRGDQLFVDYNWIIKIRLLPSTILL